MANLAILRDRRGRIKAQVTRILTFFNEHEEITAIEAQLRLKKLEQSNPVSFEAIQGEIDEIAQGSEEEKQVFDAEQEQEKQLFEDRYYEIAAKAQTIIDAATKPTVQRVNDGIQNQENEARIIIQEVRNKPKLPDIKLLEFIGGFTKWQFRKNSFETTINNDDDLTKMQKHQYLIGLLKDDALKVIEGMDISDENYDNAGTLLKSTYDNQMMIIETHIEEILDFPPISRENKAESMQQLIWHIQRHISSLKTLSQPVDHWDALIIHLVKKKLDFIEQKDWLNTIKDKTPQNMPKLTELIAFLTQRCQTLRMAGKITQKEEPISQKKEVKNGSK